MGEQQRLLVFGASGFLGSRLCEQAKASGFFVCGTHLRPDPERAAMTTSVDWQRCDITDHDAMRRVVEDVRPTHIVNTAYKQSGDDVALICADAPEAMAELAREFGARFVHVSTDLVFDGTLGRPYREHDATSPLGAYGQAKTDAEQRVLAVMPSAIIVRTSLIYGHPTAPQEQLVRRAHDDGEVAFFTDEWRTAVHVVDLATAIVDLLVSNPDFSGLLHLAGSERLNRLQFAQCLANWLDLDATKLVGRTQDPSLGPRASDVSLDTGLAASIGLALPGPTKRLGDTFS